MAIKTEYDLALSYLKGLYYHGIKLGLENTYRMLQGVHNPHQKIKCIHVGGTNGKGSVSSMLMFALTYSGLTTGLFTSPHLVSIRERFRINGKAILEQEFAELVFFLKEQIQSLFDIRDNQGPTFFEFMTVLAFLYFQRNNVDIAIIEVGMGGRLDSTNVIVPLLSVITEVNYDHTKPLGNNLKDIAREKSGIIKPGVPVICGDRKCEVREVITSYAKTTSSDVYLIGRDFDTISWEHHKKKTNFVQFNRVRWKGRDANIVTSLVGKHQCQNLSIAFATIMILREIGVDFSLKKAIQGFEHTFWPARLQFLPDRIVIDVAHNVSAISELTNTLCQLYPTKKWNVMFAVLSDKDWPAMIKKLMVIAEGFYLVEIPNPRSEPPLKIKDFIVKYWPNCPIEIFSDVGLGLDKLGLNKNGLVTGSSYLAGEVLSIYCDKINLNVLDIS